MDEMLLNRTDLNEHYEARILKSLRRIMHVSDSYSRQLNDQSHITSPQMVCLRSLLKDNVKTQAELIKQVDLGGSTVNGIIDRLELKEMVTRQRCQKDRRRVILEVTEKGRAAVASAPSMLQPNFAHRFKNLPDLEQAAIALSLERVVELMTCPLSPEE